MSEILDSLSGLVVGLLLLLTPTVFIQGLMVCLIIFLIWLEYFSKSLKKGRFEYITLPLSGIMSSVMIYFAPIIHTNSMWAIAFMTYTLFISIVLKIIFKKMKGRNKTIGGEEDGKPSNSNKSD